jgi:hypothetical protein
MSPGGLFRLQSWLPALRLLAATFRTVSLMWCKDGRTVPNLERPIRWLLDMEGAGRKGGGAMSNSTLLWPTQEQLRRRYELMDRMMQVRGVDVPAALRADVGLAFIEAREMSLLPPRRGVPPLAADQSTADVPGLLPKRCIFPVLPKRRLRRMIAGEKRWRLNDIGFIR